MLYDRQAPEFSGFGKVYLGHNFGLITFCIIKYLNSDMDNVQMIFYQKLVLSSNFTKYWVSNLSFYYQMTRSISSKLFVIASGEANVYGSSYYWNFRTSSFKQVACLILLHETPNLSSVNYLMTTVKIERAFIHLRSHIYLFIIHMT
jgi:hypothetical protein